jgi:hypothetical protein
MTAVNGGPIWSAGKCTVQSIMSFGKKVAVDRPCGRPCMTNTECKKKPSKTAVRQNVVKYDKHGFIIGFDTNVDNSPAECVHDNMVVKGGGMGWRRFGGNDYTTGFCRRCVAGGNELPGKEQVKYLASVATEAKDAWEHFQDKQNKYGRCKHNLDCQSDMCFGNNFGINEGHCAPYALPIGAPCYYKQSCGTTNEPSRKCIGNAFGRKGVCWWKNDKNIAECKAKADTNKPGGCQCSKDSQCKSKLCLGNWWTGFGSVGVCQTAKAPKSGAPTGDPDAGDHETAHCTDRKTEGACMEEQSSGKEVHCTWCSGNRVFAKCRKKVRKFSCSGPRKCPNGKTYKKETNMCVDGAHASHR